MAVTVSLTVSHDDEPWSPDYSVEMTPVGASARRYAATTVSLTPNTATQVTVNESAQPRLMFVRFDGDAGRVQLAMTSGGTPFAELQVGEWTIIPMPTSLSGVSLYATLVGTTQSKRITIVVWGQVITS